MKIRLVLPALTLFLAIGILAGCNTPQPLPVAPTPIATLIPATLPPPDAAAGGAELVGVRFPVDPPVAADGAATYNAKCAACHGANGEGVVEGSRDFSDVDYMRAASPVSFFQSVTAGKEKMPSYEAELSDEERWDVVYYLWHFSVPAAEIAKGQPVYDTNCASCHGPEGQGVIPQAAKFTPEYIAKAPATQFYQSVSAGKGIMPAWQDRLSPEERWAAIEYVRAFGYEPVK